MKSTGYIKAAAVALMLTATQAQAMSGYKWKNRPVVVFAGPGGEAQLAEQRRLFSGKQAGLKERDIVVIWVDHDSVRTQFGPGPGLSAAQLRTRFGVENVRFRVVLVGKDGGTKISQSRPLSVRQLFATIDAMPMRQEEMRRQR
ncbi:MAG: DUF4174 domain-containing protein [Filomicrobium sp.]